MLTRPQISSDARRKRLHRARIRCGLRVVPVEISVEDEDFLREARLLAEWDSDDGHAVGRAIAKLLAVLRHA